MLEAASVDFTGFDDGSMAVKVEVAFVQVHVGALELGGHGGEEGKENEEGGFGELHCCLEMV